MKICTVIYKVALVLLAVTSSQLAAATSCRCGPFDLFGGAHALYWKACNHELQYGQIRENITAESIDLESLVLVPNYHLGFRVFFGACFDPCNKNMGLIEWSRVDGSTDVTVEAKDRVLEILPIEALVNGIRAKQKTLFNSVSAKFFHRFSGNDCTHLYGYVGGLQMNVRLTHFAGSLRTVPEESSLLQTKYGGGGVEGGIGARISTWCGFGVNFRLGLQSLIGNRAYFVQKDNGIGANTLRSNRYDGSTCVLGAELRVEIDYLKNFGCWWIKAQVGWEARHYANLLLYDEEQIGIGGVAFSGPEDFDISGLYWGVTVGF